MKNPFLAALKQIPSTSQHPSQTEELVTCQFSSAPWTAPPEFPPSRFPRRPPCTTHCDWHHRERKGRPCSPLSLRTYRLVQGRRVTRKENSLTWCWVFTWAAEGPSQPTLDSISIHAFGCYGAAAVCLVLHQTSWRENTDE